MGGFSDYGDSFKPTIGANSLYLCLDSLDDTQLRQLETGFAGKVEAAQKEGLMNTMYEFTQLKEGDQSRAMQACQLQALQIVTIERKQGEPSVEEIVQDALNQTTSAGMTEEHKAHIKEKMVEKATHAAAKAVAMKKAAEASAAAWAQMSSYLDMCSGGGFGVAEKAWAASKLLAKVATIVLRMRYCSTPDSCVGAITAIIKHARDLEAKELNGKKVNELQSTCLLHCLECDRRENVKKGVFWPNTDNGNRWMFSLEKGYMGVQRWQLQHVVCSDGLLSTYETPIVDVNGDVNPRPIKSFPITPGTSILNAEQKKEYDIANPKVQSKLGKVGDMAGGAMAGGAMAKKLEGLKALASVPTPAIFAMCHKCGYASPLDKAPSAGDLLANAGEGDRRTLVQEVKMSDNGETELPVKLKVSKHSIHVQRTDGKKAKTDLYGRIHATSVFVDNGTKNNNVQLVPVRAKDAPPLIKCAEDSKAKAAEYAADALSEPATMKEGDVPTPIRSWAISAHANELRSNGWNYVLKCERIETPDDTYWVKARFREFDTLKHNFEFHFPYVMDTIKSPFPDKQKVKVNVALVVLERKKKLDVWLKDVVLKQALYESKVMQEFLKRDDSVQFIDMKEYLKNKAEEHKSKITAKVGEVKNAVAGHEVSAEQVAAAKGSEEKLFEAVIDPAKLVVQIVGAQEQRAASGNYMLYIMEMKKGGKIWRLAHRYDDFFKLSSEICRAFPHKSVIRLPASKKLQKQTGRAAVGTSMKVNEQMIEERKTTLWQVNLLS
jgi:hypothetical protein